MELREDVSRRGKIGVQFRHQSVVQLLSGSPAEGAGIRVGNRLFAADGVSPMGDAIDATFLIAGERGTALTITVLRNGQQMDITVVRGEP